MILNEKIEKLINKVKSSTPARAHTKKRVVYNDINLVGVVVYAHNKYVNNVMRVLFTVKELQNGIISDEDSISKRNPLDGKRIALLKGNYSYKIKTHLKI